MGVDIAGGQPFGMALVLYNETGRRAAIIGSYVPLGSGLRVEGGDDVTIAHTVSNGSRTAGIHAFIGTDTGPQSFTVVAFVANATWDLWVEANPGSSIVAMNAGDQVHHVPGREFTGVAFAEAWVGSWIAHVAVERSHALTIENTFIGMWGPWAELPGLYRVETPDETRICATNCFFLDPPGPKGAGPGDYTFVYTTAMAGLRGPPQPLLGADVVFPRV